MARCNSRALGGGGLRPGGGHARGQQAEGEQVANVLRFHPHNVRPRQRAARAKPQRPVVGKAPVNRAAGAAP